MKKTLLLCSLLAVSSLSFAEEEDTAKIMKVKLDEVLVTGIKQENANRSPLSVSSVGQSFLQNNEIKSVKELSGFIPNFFMPDYGSKQNSPVYIRGIGSKINAPSIGFYVDDIPHFENSAFDIDLSDVSSIEVLRGPQGTLYGRNAIGGIINIHTFSPLDYQNTRMKVGYGNYNDFETTISNYTKVNNKFGFSVMGTYHQNDGYFVNHATDDKADNIRNGAGRVSMVWKPSLQWTLRLSSSLDISNQGGYPYGAYDPETKNWSGVDYDSYSLYRRTMVSSGISARYEGRSFLFNSQTSYQFIRDHQGIDQDFTPNPIYYVTNRLHQNMFSEELTFRSKGEGPYHWITGVFLFSQKADNTVDVNYLTKDFSTPKYYEIPTRGLAVYHQSTYDLYKGLSASVGLRYDYEYSKNTYEAYKQTTAGDETMTSSFDSKLHFNQFTPKFTIQSILSRNNLLYASVARGYKAGGFNLTFQTDDERSFKPEYNWNYEIGTKLHFFDNRLYAELCLFYIDWRNQQINKTIPGVGNIQQNAGHSDSKGMELTLQSTPVKGLHLQFNYGYTYARFLEYKKSNTEDYSGQMLPLVPRNTLALNADYSLYKVFHTIDRLTFSGSLLGIGKIYWMEDNAVAQPFYMTLNLKVMATKGHFTWEVWSKNVTDTDYISYYFVSGGKYAQKGKPFTIGTSVIVNL